MDLNIRSTIRLNNEVEIPRLGLGVYQTPAGSIAERAVTVALDIGYRHVDTAQIYENEQSVGEAVRNGGVPREEIFVTTKLGNADHGYDRAISACRRSLDALGLEYVDLYLIHWPVEGLRGNSWQALETLYEEGLCRSIGVSNYMTRHLEELLDSCRVVPVVNQVEFSPFLFQRELLDFCRGAGIVVEAYSPLTKAQRLADPHLVSVAERYGRTAAQVLIRWALQHDMVVLPKSEHPERIRENASVFDFELSAGDMQELDGLDEGLRTSWDPTDQA